MSDSLTESQQDNLMDEMIRSATRDIESFIRTGPLDDERPKRTVLLCNGILYSSTKTTHAEQIALDSIGDKITSMTNIDIYINYSPCQECAARISQIVQDHTDLKVNITLAKVFQIYVPHQRGLKELKTQGVTLKAMEGQDWKTIVVKILQHYGKDYWEKLLDKIFEVQWESGQETVLHWILTCHKRVYQSAESMQMFIKDWEDRLDTAFLKLSLDDREGRWENDLEQILKDNWSKGKREVLKEILKNHGMDKWEIVLMQILKRKDNFDWRPALKVIVEKQYNLELQHNNSENDAYFNYLLLWGWETSTVILYQHGLDSRKDRLTEILQNNGQRDLEALVWSISHKNRQGYAWLKLVLEWLLIENRTEWSGRRIIADYHAAQKLEQCYL
ncbi:uncharacterized protein LOC119735760 [Patiria miniata]|uniref:CMP/dCMP-type deaminase domain-containing protein n=1 Tax=Patiria miniata TaxID=46514 RepID=A0A914APQ3_PATMI|nr:uncharacterized protein LOC119735760 [Patiria miniata]